MQICKSRIVATKIHLTIGPVEKRAIEQIATSNLARPPTTEESPGIPINNSITEVKGLQVVQLEIVMALVWAVPSTTALREQIFCQTLA